ncbi:hypothetical protein TNCV_3834552 [Trichonephila clavipes]|nr:hypothetical protein TNCV_3834552 [Trichonephila clavipes]
MLKISNNTLGVKTDVLELIYKQGIVPLKSYVSRAWGHSLMILPFRVTIEPAETHDTATHIMTYPPPCLSVGRRLSQYHTLVQVSAKRGPVLL